MVHHRLRYDAPCLQAFSLPLGAWGSHFWSFGRTQAEIAKGFLIETLAMSLLFPLSFPTREVEETREPWQHIPLTPSNSES